MIDLTVLTPTYNRANLLKNCFSSLKAQTCKDFEWLIIDDGSTDETEQVVESFKAENAGVSIRYYRKENGGKHTALNFSHDFINGKYVITVDSDDMLTENAVEKILSTWKRYEMIEDIWCLSFLKGYDINTPVCTWNSKEEIVSDHIRFRIKKDIKGDCAEVVKSEIFKMYTFPEFVGEKFFGEGYLWITAAYFYKTVYIADIIYLCEYLEGGLTKSGKKMRLRNPHGGMFTSNLYLSREFPLKYRIKNAILYDVYARAAGHPVKYIQQAHKKFLCYLCLPFGWMFYRKWSK